MRLLALPILIGLSACATTTTTTPDTATATTTMKAAASLERGRRPAPPAKAITVAPLEFSDTADFAYVDGKTGEQLSFSAVLERLRESKVVVVGEQHDQASHHELQRRVVQAMAGDGPGLVVGLEMLSWEHQPELDRFNQGDVDADGLRDAVDWKKAWGFDFGLYEPIFNVGHTGGARFLALNAPRGLVRSIRRQGLDGLSPSDRAMVPELDLGDPLHRAWFERIFSSAGHPLKAADVDGFYRAQVLWDESMADRAATAIKEGARQVIVLAGAGHVANGRGIPQRVERRLGVRVLAVVPMSGVDNGNAVEAIQKAVRAGEGDILVVPRFEPEIAL
ncbi:MAG: ChaN family lipoprotein [Deltaproteobacteria bacterium]|nr:ChaN family lipoprotein [Deltaproteobacteria bacterium]